MIRARVLSAGAHGLVALALAGGPSVGHAAPAAPANPPQDAAANGRLDTSAITAWVEAVHAHRPGTADEAAQHAAAGAGGGNGAQVIADVVMLIGAERQYAGSDEATRARVSVTYRHRALALPQVDGLLGLTDARSRETDANDLLKRGALLHTDIARLIASRINLPILIVGNRVVAPSGSMTTVVRDGSAAGAQAVSPHWALARQLLDAVAPSPAADPTVGAWYDAIVAAEFAQRRWGPGEADLTPGLKALPGDARVQFAAGVMHEAFAAPAVQNTLEAMRDQSAADRTRQALSGRPLTPAPAGTIPVRARREELLDAEWYFRQAIALDPSMVEAHLRLGHVLEDVGHPDQALPELALAAAGSPEAPFQYYVALFEGRADAALGRADAAHAAYARASGLFPGAQAPILADAQLARRFDDPARALAGLARLRGLPDGPARDDPWWSYDVYAFRDAGALMDELYRPFLDAAPHDGRAPK